MTWQLWECIPREALAKLAMFQWEKHGLVLELMTQKQEPGVFVEGLEEIGKLMRKPPSRSRGENG